MIMRDIIVFGVGQIAELADFYFKHDSERTVRAFVVDGAFRKEDNFLGRPVVALEEAVHARDRRFRSRDLVRGLFARPRPSWPVPQWRKGL